MIALKTSKLHWIDKSLDYPKDLCAHGFVEFVVDHVTIARPEDGNWCVSATALYLLRTLSQSHTPETPVGEHIFPCCGHSMYWDGDGADCLIWGCSNGINFDLIHTDGDVVITTQQNQVVSVSFEAWREAVCSFSDEVTAFYEASSPKEPYDDDRKGFEAFQNEWKRRREQAETMHPPS